jgi:hypothetical protein
MAFSWQGAIGGFYEKPQLVKGQVYDEDIGSLWIRQPDQPNNTLGSATEHVQVEVHRKVKDDGIVPWGWDSLSKYPKRSETGYYRIWTRRTDGVSQKPSCASSSLVKVSPTDPQHLQWLQKLGWNLAQFLLPKEAFGK